jgi:hypothetical protein
MQHPNSLIDSHEHPDASPWGGVDDAAWQAIAENLQLAADEHAQDAPELPVESVRPAAGFLTSVTLGQPRLLTDRRANQAQPTHEKEAPHPEYTPWWDKGGFHTVAKAFKEPIFKEVAPDEEFVVGQADRSLRVFNFGEPLSAERQKDLEQFVEIASQFMGDRAYDFISDVIIGEFALDAHDQKSNAQHGYAGFGWSGRGVVLINTAILPNDAPVDETATGSSFLQTLLHEFGGHLVHGDVRDDPRARTDLERFAEAVGWDIKGMEADSHDWNAKGADNRPYAPLYARPNAVLMPPDGSPTEYGTTDPKETFGETSKHMMAGSKVLDIMPETSGAWLETLQKRLLKPGEVMGDRPIATPLNREPVHFTRYTGASIRYPWQERRL